MIGSRREAPRRIDTPLDDDTVRQALETIEKWHRAEAINWRSGQLAEMHLDFAVVLSYVRKHVFRSLHNQPTEHSLDHRAG